MKKIVYTLLMALLIVSPAMAADKAKLKVGSASGVAKEGIVAATQGDFINVSLIGAGKKGAASVTVLIPTNASFEKGSKIGLFSLVGESDDDNPGEAALGFNGTKIAGRGGVSFAPAENTVVTGNLKVISYNEETKELKFKLLAKATPYTFVKTTLSGSKTKTPSKKLPIKVQGVVTLP